MGASCCPSRPTRHCGSSWRARPTPSCPRCELPLPRPLPVHRGGVPAGRRWSASRTCTPPTSSAWSTGSGRRRPQAAQARRAPRTPRARRRPRAGVGRRAVTALRTAVEAFLPPIPRPGRGCPARHPRRARRAGALRRHRPAAGGRRRPRRRPGMGRGGDPRLQRRSAAVARRRRPRRRGPRGHRPARLGGESAPHRTSGQPDATLDGGARSLWLPDGELVYAERGLAVRVNPANGVLLGLLGFAPTTCEDYREPAAAGPGADAAARHRAAPVSRAVSHGRGHRDRPRRAAGPHVRSTAPPMRASRARGGRGRRTPARDARPTAAGPFAARPGPRTPARRAGSTSWTRRLGPLGPARVDARARRADLGAVRVHDDAAPRPTRAGPGPTR